MGSNLVNDFIYDFIDQDSPEVGVTTSYTSETLDITRIVDEFSIQVNYANAASLDCDIIVEVSNDAVLFAPFDSKNKTEVGTAGHLFDAAGTGAGYLRVRVEVNSGSLDITDIMFRGKKRK